MRVVVFMIDGLILFVVFILYEILILILILLY